MPIIRASEATTYEVHGSTFHSYVAPSRLQTDVCTWQVEVPPNLQGATHRPSRDEVIRVLTGQLVASTNGESASLDAGDVVFIRAGSDLRLDGGPEGGTAWVCTTPGLEAVMNDGSRITPPWAN